MPSTILNTAMFQKLLAGLRKKSHLIAKHNTPIKTLIFPDELLDSFSFTTEQLQAILSVFITYQNISYTLHLGDTPLEISDPWEVSIKDTLRMSRCKNLKNIVVSYSLTETLFAEMHRLRPDISLSSLVSLDTVHSETVEGQMIKINSAVPRAPVDPIRVAFQTHLIDLEKSLSVLIEAENAFGKMTNTNADLKTILDKGLQSIAKKYKYKSKINNIVDDLNRTMATLYSKLKMPPETYPVFVLRNETYDQSYERAKMSLENFQSAFTNDIDKCSAWQREFANLREKAFKLKSKGLAISRAERLALQEDIDFVIMIFSDGVAISEGEGHGSSLVLCQEEENEIKSIQTLLFTVTSPSYSLAVNLFNAVGLSAIPRGGSEFAITPHCNPDILFALHGITSIAVQCNRSLLTEARVVEIQSLILPLLQELLCFLTSKPARHALKNSFNSFKENYSPIYKANLKYIHAITSLLSELVSDEILIGNLITQLTQAPTADDKLALMRELAQTDNEPLTTIMIHLEQLVIATKFTPKISIDLTAWIKNTVMPQFDVNHAAVEKEGCYQYLLHGFFSSHSVAESSAAGSVVVHGEMVAPPGALAGGSPNATS